MMKEVPKPSIEFKKQDGEETRETRTCEIVPQPDDSGTSEAQVAEAVAIAERAGRQIAASFHSLAPRHKRSVLMAFRHQLFPPSKPGRKRSKEITAAYADWKTGIRVLTLYRKHIPRFDRISIWKRKVKARALMDAIRGRHRREARRRTQSV